MSTTALTDTEREILDFEDGYWRYAGAKDAEIRRRFDLTPTRYYQVLDALIDRPEAGAYNPIGVGRLRRLRIKRRDQRSAARLRAIEAS